LVIVIDTNGGVDVVVIVVYDGPITIQVRRTTFLHQPRLIGRGRRREEKQATTITTTAVVDAGGGGVICLIDHVLTRVDGANIVGGMIMAVRAVTRGSGTGRSSK